MWWISPDATEKFARSSDLSLLFLRKFPQPPYEVRRSRNVEIFSALSSSETDQWTGRLFVSNRYNPLGKLEPSFKSGKLNECKGFHTNTPAQMLRCRRSKVLGLKAAYGTGPTVGTQPIRKLTSVLAIVDFIETKNTSAYRTCYENCHVNHPRSGHCPQSLGCPFTKFSGQ